MSETQNYVTGEDFLKAVDEMNQYIDKRANPALLKIIHTEVKTYGDTLRWEIHNKLEKTMKATETERMQSMSELERRINKSIGENTANDKKRGRWIIVNAVITLANLAALVTLYLKIKGTL